MRICSPQTYKLGENCQILRNLTENCRFRGKPVAVREIARCVGATASYKHCPVQLLCRVALVLSHLPLYVSLYTSPQNSVKSHRRTALLRNRLLNGSLKTVRSSDGQPTGSGQVLKPDRVLGSIPRIKLRELDYDRPIIVTVEQAAWVRPDLGCI